MRKCIVEYDHEFATKHEVFLVSFANGQIDNSDGTPVNFRPYVNTSNADGLERRRKRKILVADTGRLQYVGYNFGPEASRSTGLCRFHVGLLNKRTKKMRLISAQHYKMQPVFEIYREEQGKEGEKSFIEQVDQLTEAFGSKKKRKAMEARQRYSVNSGSLEEATKNAVDEGKELTAQLKPDATSENQPEAIPPQNKSATNAKEVYQIHDIISEEEFEALHEIAELFLNATVSDVNTWKKEERFPSYVLKHVMLGAQKKGVSEHTAKLLCYFVFLMYMLELKSRDVRQKDPLPDVPEPFKNTILDKYTIQQKYESGKLQRNFPQRLKDKVVASLLVLALFLDEFQVNLTDLQKNFKIPMTRLTSVSYALGCHVRSVKKPDKGLLHHAELKIPLFVKRVIQKGRKRK